MNVSEHIFGIAKRYFEKIIEYIFKKKTYGKCTWCFAKI